MILATRRRKLAIAGILSSFGVLFLLALQHESPRAQWARFTGTKTTTTSNTTAPSIPTTTFCEDNSCLDGTWIPRQKPFTAVEELKPWIGCPSPPPAAVHRTEDEQDEADANRLLDLMNWEWQPDNGVLKDWDAEAFVIRLLRSPGGMVIVGDEMSDQYFSSLVVLLRRSGIILDLKPSEQPFIHSYISNNKTLAERAGVPASRLERPILTLIEDSLLISAEELKSIAKRVGAIADYATWNTTLPQADDWTNFVARLSKGQESEDTVLLMNTGINWSREHLTILRPRNRPIDEQTRLTEAYRQMVRILANQLKEIPQLSIYYRSTTPGHPNCGARSIPYINSNFAEGAEGDVVARLTKGVLSEAQREFKQKWDWDLFNMHNDVWRRATVRLEAERQAAATHWATKHKKRSKWYYLDVWNQTLQRPDAHYKPFYDCLNWCPPAIFDQWTLHMHHNLQMKTEKSTPPTTDQTTDMG